MMFDLFFYGFIGMIVLIMIVMYLEEKQNG